MLRCDAVRRRSLLLLFFISYVFLFYLKYIPESTDLKDELASLLWFLTVAEVMLLFLVTLGVVRPLKFEVFCSTFFVILFMLWYKPFDLKSLYCSFVMNSLSPPIIGVQEHLNPYKFIV